MTLIWPLRLHTTADRRNEGLVGDWAAEMCRGQIWKAKDPYDRERAPNSNEAYSEFVYFEPYVQRFLYGDRRDGSLPHATNFRLIQRDDVKRVAVTLLKGDAALLLDVIRLQLYLFDTGVVLMVIEVSASNWSFDQTLTFQNFFRRSYPPYWSDHELQTTHPEARPGQCPELVEWQKADGEPVGDLSTYQFYSRFKESAYKNRLPAISAHWSSLLLPMQAYVGNAPAPGEWLYQHLGDERIPYMSYWAVDHPERITPGEWARLTFADGPGSSEFPYAKIFLTGLQADYRYDRFWDVPADYVPSLEARAAEIEYKTRYVCAGYAFSVVGSSNDFNFKHPEWGVLAHYRAHYFQLGLIAHLQKASLLVIADRIAAEVRKLPDSEDRTGYEAIEMDLTAFFDRYWFHDVSAQEQGRELFRWWTRHLRLAELSQQVRDETQFVNQVLRTRSDTRRNDFSAKLTKLATLAIGPALVASFWGMNIVTDSVRYWLREAGSMPRPKWSDAWEFGAFLLPSLLAWVLLKNWADRSRKGRQ